MQGKGCSGIGGIADGTRLEASHNLQLCQFKGLHNIIIYLFPNREHSLLEMMPLNHDVMEGEETSTQEAGNELSEAEELERLQRECSAMVKLLKNLEKEENDLQCQLEVLAREVILCGFDPAVVEPASAKRRRTTVVTKTKKETQ